MNYIEFRVIAHAKGASLLSDQLTELGAVAVTFQDHGNEPIFEPSIDTPRVWPKTEVLGLFTEDTNLQPVIAHLEAEQHAFTQTYIEDQDWVRASKDLFQPMKFGHRLWVSPSWQKPPDENAINVILDPGLAFGTGTHPTTALCLEWLSLNIDAQDEVIDYGTGSGILGIAAQKLGAKKVIAVDNDPVALQTAAENAQKNGLSSPQFCTYLPENLFTIKADLIIANILKDPLIQLAPLFAKLTKKHGVIILSGILTDDVHKICDIYKPWYTMQQPVFKEDWVLLIGIRSNSN